MSVTGMAAARLPDPSLRHDAGPDNREVSAPWAAPLEKLVLILAVPAVVTYPQRRPRDAVVSRLGLDVPQPRGARRNFASSKGSEPPQLIAVAGWISNT